MLSQWVIRLGYSPRTADSADAAVLELERGDIDVALCDIRMPGKSGLRLLEEVKRSDPTLPVIVMTAHSDLDSAVAVYQGGAFEYLPKPFDIDDAVSLVRRAAHQAIPAQEMEPASASIPELLIARLRFW